MTSVQLVVVGGGPGGYAAAFLAADLGLSVALVDPEVNPGGVCVYRGCIPSKALLHVAKLLDESRHAKAWGVEFGEPTIDLDKLRDFKNNVVKRLTSGTGQLVKHRKVQYLQGWAEIVDAHNLTVKLTAGGEETVQFEHAHPRDRIAAGDSADAEGRRPARDGLDRRARSPRHSRSRCSSSAAATSASSSARVYAALGSAVTVVEMTPGLLPGADRDLVDVLAKRVDQTMKSVLLETQGRADEGRGRRASA